VFVHGQHGAAILATVLNFQCSEPPETKTLFPRPVPLKIGRTGDLRQAR
jgi:hypothetical protein